VSRASAYKESKVSLGKVLLGLLAWLAAGVIVGIPVGKALKASREAMESEARAAQELQELVERQGLTHRSPDPPVRLVPPVSQ
jgi:hypothetical protein